MNFSEIEIQSFLSKKVDGNRKSTDYWKVLVSKFSEIGNTVFLSQKVDGKVVIFTDYWKVLVLNFSEIGNTVGFFEPKSRETWCFWAFYDIPGLGKYGFLCNGIEECWILVIILLCQSIPSLCSKYFILLTKI